MLILTKAMLAMMIGLLLSAIFGLVLIPLLKRRKINQRVSSFLPLHSGKNTTPSFGGFIFIIPTLATMLILFLMGKIDFSSNLFIVIFVFVSYAFIGFLDDYMKQKRKNNEGLSRIQKLFGQLVISIIFFFLYMQSGAEPILHINTLGINIDLGFAYGIFILLYLVGFSNAVNITDGLDGLAGGLSAVAFLTIAMITYNTTWLLGYEDIAIFCFVLTGSLVGFLLFNTHPAKIFMGDVGSLPLGAVMATIAILNKHEVTILIVGGVFIFEMLTSAVQIFSIRILNKRIFKMAPFHHHLEQMKWAEQDIVKLFLVIGLILSMASIAFGVWI